MKFVRTTVTAGHYHIAFVSDQGPILLSYDLGHTHEVHFPPVVVQGPQGPTEVPGPPVIQPSPVDGHIHAGFEELRLVEYADLSPHEEDVVIAEVRKLYVEARDYEKDSRKDGKESEDFYSSKGHWTKKQESDLEATDRAALTINEIEPKIDILTGYQRQNRYDIRFLPVEGGDQRKADMLNALVKNIMDRNDGEYAESEVFEDGTIAGRGAFHCYVDYDRTLFGDIVIERFPWDDFYCGPHLKLDLSDCEYIVKAKWYSEQQIQRMFPEKADKIRKDFIAYMGGEMDQTETRRRAGDQYSDESPEAPAYSIAPKAVDSDFFDVAKKQFKLFECWRKEYTKIPVIVNPMLDIFHNAKNWQSEDLAAVPTIPGFSVVRKTNPRMRLLTVAGETVLQNTISNIYEDFPIIVFYAKRRNHRFWGKVEAAKDPQRELNKLHSQGIDILNKTAAYGWFYDHTTFASPTDEATFREIATQPGFTMKVKNADKIPVKVEGVRFPAEIVNFAQIHSQLINRIMNVNPEIMGLESRAESGIAQIERKKQALIGNEFLFDNLARAKKRLGRTIVTLMQKTYTPERMLKVLEGVNSMSTPVKLAEQPLGAYNREELLELLRNDDLLKYDVAVTESAWSPTNRRSNFAVWGEMARNGVPVPMDVLIDLSDLPDKERVKAQVQAEIKARQEAEQQKYNAEIQKTLIASGGRGGGTPGTAF